MKWVILTRSIKPVKGLEVTVDSVHLGVEIRLLASCLIVLRIENLDLFVISLAHLKCHVLIVVILHAALIRDLNR